MAVDKPKGSDAGAPEARRPAAPPPEAAMAQKRRWLVFGSNVVVALLLATALVVAAVWLTTTLLQGKARSDWTAGGRFRLSERTRALLADIPSDVDIRITNLYQHTPQIPESEEQYSRVQDLLTEYGAVSPRITVEAVNPGVDTSAAEALLDRLKKRYASETEKPKAQVEAFKTLHADIGKVLEAEADRLAAAAEAWKDAPRDLVSNLQMVSQGWRQLRAVGQFIGAAVDSLAGQGLPAYSSAVSRAGDFLKPVEKNFGEVQKVYDQLLEQAKTANLALPADVKAILEGGKATYEPLRERIQAFLKEGEALGEQKLESLNREIARGESILIEVPQDVRVVAFDDVWTYNPDAQNNPDAPERLFDGESAVSTALWGLLHKVKPAVLFVTYGSPASGWGGPFAGLADRIRKANFIVQDWDLLRDHEMPKIEEWEKLEPEERAKEKEQVLLVLVPPPPPDMRRPMPPATPEAYEPAVDAVRGGAPAVLLADAMEQSFVPYKDLFATFGLAPRFDAVAVQKMVVDSRGTERAVPFVHQITAYPAHAITRALRGLPTTLLTAVPMMPMEKPPEGVKVEPILLLPAGPDYWADTTMMEAMNGEAKRDEALDLIPTAEHPVPLGVAVTRKVGDAEQHVVVFGDAHFAQDRVGQYPRDALFPGNAEIFVNSLLWITGKDQLVTVSPEVLRARRLGDIGTWGTPLRILMVAGVPAGVALVGLVVFLIRRR